MYPLLHRLQSPSESHEVHALGLPLAQLQHLPPLQLPLLHQVEAEHVSPSAFWDQHLDDPKYPLRQLLQLPLESHDWQPEPYLPLLLQHLPFLQLLPEHWLEEEHDEPSLFFELELELEPVHPLPHELHECR